MTIKLHTVPTEDLTYTYNVCEDMLCRNSFDVDRLIDNLKTERERLVMFYEDSAVVACATYQKLSDDEIRLRLGACREGYRVDYVQCVRLLEALAKNNGYKRISIQGRRGWQRALEDYDHEMTIIGKDL